MERPHFVLGVVWVKVPKTATAIFLLLLLLSFITSKVTKGIKKHVSTHIKIKKR